MSSKMKPSNSKPAGEEPYDAGALNELQQEKLNQKKIQIRIANENYLRKHPEVNLLVQDFLKQCFLNKPKDVREFAAVYFTSPTLQQHIDDLMQNKERKFELGKIIQQMKIHYF